MLLVITNTQDVTADYLADILDRSDVNVTRFDTDSSLQDAGLQYDGGNPKLRLGETWYDPEDFHHVWYRRPERLRLPQQKDSPESNLVIDEWSEALEGFFAHIPREKWMNHPSCEASASHKLEQLTRAKRLGFSTPSTLVTQDIDELRTFFRRHGDRLIVKPMGRGHIERGPEETDSIIFTNRVSPQHLEQCKDLEGCPTLFQEEIRKRSDVRITVVDTNVHAVELIAPEEDGSQRCDIRRNHMDDVVHSPVTLPQNVEEKIRMLVNDYRLRFAAIDMAVTLEGDWVFFEINPNGQWAWMDLKGVTAIASSFVTSFRSEPGTN